MLKKIPDGFLPFACVGAVGFIVDAGILNWLIFSHGWDHYTARIASFAVAVLVTWFLNRNWAFRHQASANKTREYSAYLTVQTIGAALNFAIYSACIFLFPWFKQYPILPLAIGSGIAMLFNFAASRRYAFTGGPQQ